MATKITKSTFKSFIKKNAGSLYVKVNSSFDGMTDCVERVSDEFTPVKQTETNIEHTMGITGVWLVGQSRDYFSHFENDQFIGIEGYNCTGSFVVAIKKEAPPVGVSVEVVEGAQLIKAPASSMVYMGGDYSEADLKELHIKMRRTNSDALMMQSIGRVKRSESQANGVCVIFPDIKVKSTTAPYFSDWYKTDLGDLFYDCLSKMWYTQRIESEDLIASPVPEWWSIIWGVVKPGIPVYALKSYKNGKIRKGKQYGVVSVSRNRTIKTTNDGLNQTEFSRECFFELFSFYPPTNWSIETHTNIKGSSGLGFGKTNKP